MRKIMYRWTILGITEKLIIINISLFIFAFIYPSLISFLSLSVSKTIMKFQLWRLFTYMFVHYGFFHLLFNMLILWMFGIPVERSLGKKNFFVYYFFCGFGAALFSLLFYSPYASVIGASGAIFGILVAYAFLYPDSIILVFFLFPMKARYAVFIFGLIDLWSAISYGESSNIANIAHIGGGVFGFLFFKFIGVRRKVLYVASLLNIKERINAVKDMKRQKVKEEVDRILDKISQYGMRSLTPREKRILSIYAKNKEGEKKGG